MKFKINYTTEIEWNALELLEELYNMEKEKVLKEEGFEEFVEKYDEEQWDELFRLYWNADTLVIEKAQYPNDVHGNLVCNSFVICHEYTAEETKELIEQKRG